eukprot:TRINITY_DN5014_c0_g1_i1.p1 TRINITY_DN5014_c0_g1~~TRINITY_DN5014_c0_g1_i1.p1  ORF type:complete len:506 (-),score=191.06 TRINITY_DN5014_c0_g1_i1:210-1727(-)
MDPSSPVQDLRSGVPDVQQLLNKLRNGLKDKSSRLFLNLKGKVFHLVGSNNKIFQYKVGLDGEITLIRRFKSLNGVPLSAENVENLLFKEVPAEAQRRFRAAVTGDPNKRIRDHMKETPQVKMLDKFSFTLGVLIICLSQYVIHRLPQMFPFYFSGLLSILFVSRFISYRKEKYHLFLLDFCYFLNVSTILQATLYPKHDTWFKINYVLSHGPLLTAIVVWQNSLVFHSMDKVTSFFLHAFAPMYCHLARWRLINPSFPAEDSTLGFSTGFLYPLLTYFLWQGLYIFLIEASPIATALQRDSELMTAYRYLIRDKKNSMAQLVKSIVTRWDLEIPTLPDGSINPDTIRMKGIYFAAQFAYSLFTLSYVWIIYKSYALSCAYILSIFIWGTWNGASYYIEVFSKRYNLKFDVKEEEPLRGEEEDSNDEDFEEAMEILLGDEEGHNEDVTISEVKESSTFILSNDEAKSYSIQELRSHYPNLLIDYLLSQRGEDTPPSHSKEDKKDV